MNIKFDKTFDYDPIDQCSKVFEVFPTIFEDNRGCFSEVVKNHSEWPKDDIPLWFSSIKWIKQVNRSTSSAGTIRGCHAQSAPMCQGKLVEVVVGQVFDIIIDARPESKTFGAINAFLLDSKIQNKLWVPKGFLHSFIVPLDIQFAIFQYFCDNTYSKQCEIGISPMSILPTAVKNLKNMNINEINKKFGRLYDIFNSSSIRLSEKDSNGLDYNTWMETQKNTFQQFGKIWYKDWKQQNICSIEK